MTRPEKFPTEKAESNTGSATTKADAVTARPTRWEEGGAREREREGGGGGGGGAKTE